MMLESPSWFSQTSSSIIILKIYWLRVSHSWYENRELTIKWIVILRIRIFTTVCTLDGRVGFGREASNLEHISCVVTYVVCVALSCGSKDLRDGSTSNWDSGPFQLLSLLSSHLSFLNYSLLRLTHALLLQNLIRIVWGINILDMKYYSISPLYVCDRWSLMI